MFKVVRTFALPGGLAIEREVLGDQVEIVERPSGTEEELIANCQDADAIICVYEPVTQRVIDALPNLKLIAFKSIGFNYADYQHAATKGIPVTNITQYCIKEVADYTLAAIMACNRGLFQYHHDTYLDKVWDLRSHMGRMRRLESQTVGLLGFGNIPKLVAKRLAPIGCRVIAYDPFVDKDKMMNDYGVEMVELDQIWQESDIISVHLPLNDQTRGIINRDKINKMKDGVCLVNAARGPIVVEPDLLEAVESGKIDLAVLDVLEEEYPDLATHPLAGHRKIILTPHIAFLSQESLEEGIVECAKNVRHFVDGDYAKLNVVNGVKL